MDEQSMMMAVPPNPVMFNGSNPVGHPGVISDTIASMRWESDPLIHQLYRMLGGYDIGLDDKEQVIRRRVPGSHPLMNDIGIERVVGLIRGMVNPVTSLSNVDDDEANELIRQVLYAFILDLVYCKERWAVNDGDMRTIMNIVKGLVFMQLKRSVAGHESKNFRTTTFEQQMNQNFSQNNGQGNSILPWKWGGSKK